MNPAISISPLNKVGRWLSVLRSTKDWTKTKKSQELETLVLQLILVFQKLSYYNCNKGVPRLEAEEGRWEMKLQTAFLYGKSRRTRSSACPGKGMGERTKVFLFFFFFTFCVRYPRCLSFEVWVWVSVESTCAGVILASCEESSFQTLLFQT